jgi:hypothetical protein
MAGFQVTPGPYLNAMQLGRQHGQQNRLLQQRQQIGQALQGGDYGQGAQAAFGQGNIETGLSLQQAQQSREQQRAELARKRQEQVRERVGRLAQYAKGIQDPEQRRQYAEQIFDVHPRFRQHIDRYGIDATNPDAALDFLIAEAGVDQPDPVKLGKDDRLVDPRSGREVVGSAAPAVDPYEAERRKAAARAQGKLEGEETAQRPQTIAKAERMLGSVDAALSDPGTFQATGPIGGLLPNVFPGSTRGQSRIDQIRGQTFLQAYQDLKGGGQITEVEGGKAEDALARINAQNMDDDDYKKSLEDLRDVVVKGLRRAKGLSTDDDVIQSLSEARKALQRGADPNAVRDRLVENGIDPTGL